MTEVARLVILAGLPGAGKSTVATWLSATHDFDIASRDVIRAAMFPRCEFTLTEKAAAFSAMMSAIEVTLALGKRVVTDGICFSSSRELQQMVDVGTAAGVSVTIVYCAVPIAVAQERVERDRQSDPTVPADRDAALVQATADRFEPLPHSAMTLDTSASEAAVFVSLASLLKLEPAA